MYQWLIKILCVSEEFAKYVPFVVKLCYAIAGIVAVVGAISVYIAIDNALSIRLKIERIWMTNPHENPLKSVLFEDMTET